MPIQAARFFSIDPANARSMRDMTLVDLFNDAIIDPANRLEPADQVEVDLDGEDAYARQRRAEAAQLDEQGSFERRRADDMFLAARGGAMLTDDPYAGITDYSADPYEDEAPAAPSSRPPASVSPAYPSSGEITTGLPERLAPLQSVFQEQGKKYGVDPKFLAAISMHETANGSSRAFRAKKNAMGVSDSSGPIAFNDPAESVAKMARLLGSRQKGPYKNARTIREIGNIYAPVGAENDPRGLNSSWAAGVTKFYKQLGGDPKTPIK